MSSKRAIRRKACAGKIRHATQAHANAHLGSLVHRIRRVTPKKTGIDSGGYVNAYACRWCNGWHVGHPPKRRPADV